MYHVNQCRVQLGTNKVVVVVVAASIYYYSTETDITHMDDFLHFIHRIHKWRTRGKKLVPSHKSEALEDKQKLQMKTFSELAECLARIPPKITLYGRLFKYNYVGCLPAFNV